MAHELSLVPAVSGAVDLRRKYARALGHWEGQPNHPITETAPLIPLADVDRMLIALRIELAPIGQERLAEWLQDFGASWLPTAAQASADLRPYLRQLREEAREFPEWALRDTLAYLRRSLKFLPSIAEVWQEARARVQVTAEQLALLEAHRAEHRRRTIGNYIDDSLA